MRENKQTGEQMAHCYVRQFHTLSTQCTLMGERVSVQVNAMKQVRATERASKAISAERVSEFVVWNADKVKDS